MCAELLRLKTIGYKHIAFFWLKNRERLENALLEFPAVGAPQGGWCGWQRSDESNVRFVYAYLMS